MIYAEGERLLWRVIECRKHFSLFCWRCFFLMPFFLPPSCRLPAECYIDLCAFAEDWVSTLNSMKLSALQLPCLNLPAVWLITFAPSGSMDKKMDLKWEIKLLFIWEKHVVNSMRRCSSFLCKLVEEMPSRMKDAIALSCPSDHPTRPWTRPRKRERTFTSDNLFPRHDIKSAQPSSV